ncbi:MAG: hypothetical protein HKO62_03790 [Gammaproteobacteria bacterium]|nr:hypothetical protein [Gammaproteobacteria bacterium]NNL99849.1 hypothetical protein [Gammaproteobacteria bacterium]
MTVCPVALMASCRKCPAVSVCPLKTVLGDYSEADSSEPGAAPDPQEPGTDKD